MIAEEVEATSWRLRETIRVRKLTTTHRLGQMRRLLYSRSRRPGSERPTLTISRQQLKWTPGARVRILFQKFCVYRNMFNPRRPHTLNEFTLEMRVDVEQLRTEIGLLQPAPSQCDSSPRRLPAVDTGSEVPGTLRHSPAIGTGSDEPGVSQTQTTERK